MRPAAPFAASSPTRQPPPWPADVRLKSLIDRARQEGQASKAAALRPLKGALARDPGAPPKEAALRPLPAAGKRKALGPLQGAAPGAVLPAGKLAKQPAFGKKAKPAAAAAGAPAKPKRKLAEVDAAAVDAKVKAGSLEALTIPELKSYLKLVGLAVGGKKADLQARIAAHREGMQVES
jgi:hypothetical protein